MALELDDIVLETSQLQVALVKMARGVSSKLNITNKPYTFICPEYEEIKKGDWVVCEVKRKTPNKNVEHDFRIGRVEEVLTWTDKEILMFRPNSFIVCKVENTEKFEKRCINITNKKRSLWARYNAYDRNGYGTYVMIFHGSGYVTLYGHLSSSHVSDGQYVKQGDVIATSGNSGGSTGAHLHFEIRTPGYKYANCVNPRPYLP